jgi:serine kinase of HPr protein (carbohydrate metabolism regulator)
MLGLTGAIYDRVGALMMHGTSIEFEGGAVTFIGPSGAGKSTAADLCVGAPILAVDKTAFYRSSEGEWRAAPLPEHRAGRMSSRRSAFRSLPLLGVLRVCQSDGRVRLEELPSLQRLVYLRESLLTGDRQAEAERFGHLENFLSQVPVNRIHTLLGAELGPIITTFAAERAQ